MPDTSLLEIQNLSIDFGTKKSKVSAVSNISFDIDQNEIVGIVGESGSGKSVTSMAVMGLLPKRHAHVTGAILFNDDDLRTKSEKELQKIRGNQIAMIFQEPMNALNPSIT